MIRIIKGILVGLYFFLTAGMAFFVYPLLFLKDVFVIVQKEGYEKKEFMVNGNAQVNLGDETGVESLITYGTIDGKEERLFEPDGYPLKKDTVISVWFNKGLNAEYVLFGKPRVLIDKTGSINFIYSDLIKHTLIFLTPFFIGIAIYKLPRQRKELLV